MGTQKNIACFQNNFRMSVIQINLKSQDVGTIKIAKNQHQDEQYQHLRQK